MNDYIFERVDANNLRSLVQLYHECFKVKVNSEFLIRKFDTQSFGRSFIGFIAFHSTTKKAVGYYGVFPLIGLIENRKLLIAQSGDTMTHPDHQGKGLFTILAKLTCELARNEGINFVFGFPNKNSYPGFIKKLGWDHYNNINNYVIKTGALPFDKLVKKFPLLKNLYELILKRRIKSYLNSEYCQNSLQSQDYAGGHIPHDNLFYHYKSYFVNYQVKLKNHCGVIKVDGRLWVGDLDCNDEESFFEDIEFLTTIARRTGCSSVYFSFFDNCLQDQYMKRRFQPNSSMPAGCLNLLEEKLGQKFRYTALDFDTY